MNVLINKVAIVTGASSGIGRATAKLFAEEGARALPGNIREEDHCRALVDLAVDRFGGLDIAFNNAGVVGQMGPAPDLSIDNWRETLDTNLTSAFLCAKYQVPAMIARGGGSMVFTSTFDGHTVGFPGMTAYAASKAGLLGLTQVLAAELGARGIRWNRYGDESRQRAGRGSGTEGLS